MLWTATKNVLSHFYERRARRLLPALCLVVFAVLLLGFALLPFPNAREQLGQSAISALLFVANRYFRLEAGNYFQLGSEQMPLLHTWSLAVEEQFYLVFPLAMILLFKFSAPANRLRLLTWSVAIVTVISFAGDVFLVRHGSHRAFYWAPARAWEIGVGALLALWMVSRPASRNPGDAPAAITGISGSAAIAAGAAIAGVAMIAGAFVGLKPDSPFPGMLALFPVLGTALIIGAVPLSPHSVIARALSSAPVIALGRVSYPWYLWHWPLLVIARRWRLGECVKTLSPVASSSRLKRKRSASENTTSICKITTLK